MNEQYNAEVNMPVAESRYAWLRGFFEIFFSPARAGSRPVLSPGKHIWFAILLWIIASVAGLYIVRSNDSLRKQEQAIVLNETRMVGRAGGMDDKRIDEELAQLRKSEKDAPVLTYTIGRNILMGLVSLMFVGTLFWILQRLFNSEPPGVLDVIAVVAYGYAIDSVGMVVSATSQALTGSIFATPSLAFLAAPLETARVWTHQLLTMLSIFTVWKYFAVGAAVAVFSGLPVRWGLLFSTVAFLFVYGIMSVLVVLYYLMF